MQYFLYHYKPIDPTTWVYLSSLLTIAIYFKFSRVWCVRNLDLLGLIALAPGLLMVDQEGTAAQFGYAWLFATMGFFLIRLLVDPSMVRRPLLEPNLSPGGLTFATVSLLVFLMANVMTGRITESDTEGARQADEITSPQAEAPKDVEARLATHGPAYPWFHLLAKIPGKAFVANADVEAAPDDLREQEYVARTRAAAMLSHLAIVIGMVLIGARHFGSVRTGVAAANLYLLLPYTAQMTGRVDHVLPTALVVWAVFAYRRPLIAGMLVGLATGVIYYPIFLLPLWIGFYWHRGLLRLLVGFLAMLALVLGAQFFAVGGIDPLLAQIRQVFGWTSLAPADINGFWSAHESANPYRLSVLAAYAALCASFALWPAQKNLGTLLSCSAAVMLGTQFWQPQQGGLYIGWYLPLLLLTIFRPNLEDRVALTVLSDGWLTNRKRSPAIRAA